MGDNIVEYTEVTTENNQYPPLTSSRKGIFLQTEYFAGNQIASDDNTGYNIVPYGYFTYRHMSDDEVFHFNINDIVEKGIVSTLYPVFTTDENLDSRYLQYQLNYGHEFAKFAILQKQGGSRTYMYLNKLRQLHLTMPNHVEEQKAISSFFMNLDHLITLHQRKYDKLQVLKKAMLEKMFPKNGSSVPEIRFKGFTDAWEQRKLEDYLTVSAEKNTDNLYTKKDVLSVSGDFGVVNQIEFQGRSFAGASVSNYGVVHTGDVVYTKSPLKANPYGIIKANKGKPGIVSVLYGVYHTRENANADFIQMYFEQDARLNNYLRPLVNKGAKNTLLISDTDALEGEVCLAPTFDEQKAIGQFFDSLDNLITLHQRELEKLQNIKKSMLEKMFV